MAEYRHWRETKRTALKDVVPLDTPYQELGFPQFDQAVSKEPSGGRK